MDYKIIPGILRTDETTFLHDLKQAETFAKTVQIDVVDGVYAQTKTVDLSVLTKYQASVSVELDLMIANANDTVTQYNLPTVRTIVLHLETLTEPQQAIATVKAMGKRCAIALLPDASFAPVRSLHSFDQITIMTVTPGRQGQPFRPEALSLVEQARSHFPELPIEVDGGMTPETLPMACRAGANCFVAGSFIFANEKPKRAFQTLTNLLPLASPAAKTV